VICPDGESGIFFSTGLDRTYADFPVGLICRMQCFHIVIASCTLSEREAVTLTLDHAIGFALRDVRPAAIKMQCRCADANHLTFKR